MTIHFFWMVFFMHISVRITTISFWMEFCHLHFCMHDYHFFLNGLSSFTFLCEWLPFLFELIVFIYIFVRRTTISFWIDCRHAHFCTNDYHFFLNRFSSCKFLYERLPFLFEWIVVIYISVRMTAIFLVWIFVMHISVRITTILLCMGFHHAHSVQMTFHILSIWFFVMHISVRMTFHILLVFPCVQCSSTRQYHGAVTDYKWYYNFYRFRPCA